MANKKMTEAGRALYDLWGVFRTPDQREELAGRLEQVTGLSRDDVIRRCLRNPVQLGDVKPSVWNSILSLHQGVMAERSNPNGGKSGSRRGGR